MKQKIYKYQGCGNDFVLVDNRSKTFEAVNERIAWMCDRHFGIGADGLMLLENDPNAEFYMRYFNADGGESTMCGNGGRCIALFAHHLGIGGSEKIFNSIDGLHKVQLLESNAHNGILKLGMIDVEQIEDCEDYMLLNTGSPHYVKFVEELDNVDITSFGRSVRYNEFFKPRGGVNVNLVRILNHHTISMKTYERGVENETLACGTGATAAVLATAKRTMSKVREYQVYTQGGKLKIQFETDDMITFKNISLIGPATKVFEAEIDVF